MNSEKAISALSAEDLAELREAKAALSARFLRGSVRATAERAVLRGAATPFAPRRNVVAIGIEEKYVGGKPVGVAAIKLLVRTKVARSELSKSELLPATVAGIPTDVEETGPIVPQAKRKSAARPKAKMPNPRQRFRPVQPGCSIGFRDPEEAFLMAGTLGLVVKDARGRKHLLSNNHVLAYENGIAADGKLRRALAKGTPIFQPGLLDDGDPTADQVATLAQWIDLRADRDDNRVDAAIARLLPKIAATREILHLGEPAEPTAAERDLAVCKFGRTTGYRTGKVTSVSFDLVVPYAVGEVLFTDQIAIRGPSGRRFSNSGDSGAAILVRGTNQVVGLLFAGATNGSYTFANHIADVLGQLKIRMA